MNTLQVKRDVLPLVATPTHPYRRLAKRTWVLIPQTKTWMLVSQIIVRTA